MKHSFTKMAFGLAATLAMGAAAIMPANSAEWPMEKAVTLVVPWGAGGALDTLVRVLADEWQKKYGQQFIVENRSGATGSIGQGYVARQKPDGYTLIATTPGPGANNKNTFSNLTYDPLTDFTPITRFYNTELAMMASPEFEPDTLQEVIDYAKKNPGKVNAGNPGFGTYAHMAEVTFADLVGIELNVVPYKSGSDDLPDLISGRIDIMMNFIGQYVEPIKAGKVKLIAVASDTRSTALPDGPTFKEEGVDFSAAAWTGLEGPKGMDPAVVAKINADVKEFMTSNEKIKTLLANISASAAPTTPEEFGQIIVEEEKKWRATIEKYEIRSN